MLNFRRELMRILLLDFQRRGNYSLHKINFCLLDRKNNDMKPI